MERPGSSSYSCRGTGYCRAQRLFNEDFGVPMQKTPTGKGRRAFLILTQILRYGNGLVPNYRRLKNFLSMSDAASRESLLEVEGRGGSFPGLFLSARFCSSSDFVSPWPFSPVGAGRL